MLHWHRVKSGTAALMAIAISTSAVIPTLIPSPAIAQVFPGQFRRLAISAGAVLPTTYSKDKIVVTPKETKKIELEIPNNIIDTSRNILIPARSKIKGRLEPATFNGEDGSQFVAEEVIFPDGRRQNIDAVSNVITNKETIRKGANTGKVLEGAAVGAGATAIISLLTSEKKINALKILAGGGLGAAASTLFRRKKVEVVVIEPKRGDLNITLRSNFVVPDR
ncbi:MAG: hypothetical protein HRU34_24915 [Richelia sp.]|nr:hypothetical protein [Richelia sp.]